MSSHDEAAVEDEYFYIWKGTILHLRPSDGGRWVLLCNLKEVCTYSSPERAATFVSRGVTGNSLIDWMSKRPQGIHEWNSA